VTPNKQGITNRCLPTVIYGASRALFYQKTGTDMGPRDHLVTFLKTPKKLSVHPSANLQKMATSPDFANFAKISKKMFFEQRCFEVDL
jgi:hypothetical protein